MAAKGWITITNTQPTGHMPSCRQIKCKATCIHKSYLQPLEIFLKSSITTTTKTTHNLTAISRTSWVSRYWNVKTPWTLLLHEMLQVVVIRDVRIPKFWVPFVLFVCLGFNGTFSTNRLYCARAVGNLSRRGRRQHKYILKQRSNTINQENPAHSSAWAFWRRSPRHD